MAKQQVSLQKLTAAGIDIPLVAEINSRTRTARTTEFKLAWSIFDKIYYLLGEDGTVGLDPQKANEDAGMVMIEVQKITTRHRASALTGVLEDILAQREPDDTNSDTRKILDDIEKAAKEIIKKLKLKVRN